MNTNELVDIIHALEGSNPNLNQYEALEQIGFYDERDDILYSGYLTTIYAYSPLPASCKAFSLK